MQPLSQNLQIDALQSSYNSGALTPTLVVQKIYPSLKQATPCFIHLEDLSKLEARCKELESLAKEQRGALYGVPFAVKDNIDVAGIPTTAACPAYQYVPKVSAPVVEGLLNAGGICVGKTNMDQFAAGLVGTRSPYGVVPNAVDSRFISGGSSSGSGALVGMGLVSFALGTDTAGSGRVPAGLNGCVGVKPTVGYLSTKGVVPACRSLDCVTVFALNIQDGGKVAEIMRESSIQDISDETVRLEQQITRSISPPLKFAAPSKANNTLQVSGAGGEIAENALTDCFEKSIRTLKLQGFSAVEDFDWSPFLEAAKMLYGSSFICERVSGIRHFLNSTSDLEKDLLPVTNKILKQADKFVGADVFDDQAKLKELKGKARAQLSKVDFLVVPTVVHHYLIKEIEGEESASDPNWTQNANLGYYTNFVNQLDMAAISVPAGTIKLDYTTSQKKRWIGGGGGKKDTVRETRVKLMTMDGGLASAELPYGVTFLAPAWHDKWLRDVATQFVTAHPSQ